MCRGHIIAAALVQMMMAMPAAATSIAEIYRCERTVELPVIYVSGETGVGVVVLLVEGEMVNLETTSAASGARYAGSPDLSGYVWWTKGDAALLTWFDASSGQETPVYSECTKVER
ncbi:MliC family protein [uncultured Roseobacter sp.]|uniref:MliC family protein n=1 Tax=uncultured Roseobacter sp. TaxID=114847 RepID=UPI00261D4FDA|nr:MliC family protein [uncultured Roseobacter sp.]